MLASLKMPIVYKDIALLLRIIRIILEDNWPLKLQQRLYSTDCNVVEKLTQDLQLCLL